MAQALPATLEQARRAPEALAIGHGDQALTYDRLAEDARVLAAGWDGQTGPVAIGGRGPELLTALLAAAICGRPACLPQADFSPAERERALAAGLRAPDDAFLVGFTSGTSGAPKPFVRGWESWETSFAPAAELHRIDARTAVVLPGALQHTHFLFGAVLALELGASVRTFPRFDASALLAALGAAERSSVFVVPTMLSAIEPRLDGYGPLAGVRSVVVSGSAYDARHRAIARRAFPNARIVQIFGASELSFVTITVDDPGGPEPGSDVGAPFPGVEIELREGEIWVRSRYLADGYVSESGEPVPIADSRGFATVGDLGTVDASGHLTLVGRASNMVITGGKNVHPEEVEAVLRDHPAVADCVVVGVPDDYWGERLVALLEPAAEVADDELVATVKQRLASHKAPKEWHRTERLPRTESGKVARATARAMVTGG
ncbi:MAG: AMP-binding protein [Baekduia sp.]